MKKYKIKSYYNDIHEISHMPYRKAWFGLYIPIEGTYSSLEMAEDAIKRDAKQRLFKPESIYYSIEINSDAIKLERTN